MTGVNFASAASGLYDGTARLYVEKYSLSLSLSLSPYQYQRLLEFFLWIILVGCHSIDPAVEVLQGIPNKSSELGRKRQGR